MWAIRLGRFRFSVTGPGEPCNVGPPSGIMGGDARRVRLDEVRWGEVAAQYPGWSSAA